MLAQPSSNNVYLDNIFNWDSFHFAFDAVIACSNNVLNKSFQTVHWCPRAIRTAIELKLQYPSKIFDIFSFENRNKDKKINTNCFLVCMSDKKYCVSSFSEVYGELVNNGGRLAKKSSRYELFEYSYTIFLVYNW